MADRDALASRETPYGSVGIVHEGRDLRAWWIYKDDEQVDPEWSVMPEEDLLYVIEGTLRLELEHEEAVELRAGQCFVIAAGCRFQATAGRGMDRRASSSR